ncbi:ankyrin [Hypoxylon crocopeplum]|nr:ankyrin [Hypoxylon crocopeplum]
MDGLSTFAVIAQVILFAGSLASGLNCFIEKTRNICDTIRSVHDEIHDLKGVLDEIQNILKKRSQQLPFEREHYAKTHCIIRSCYEWLQELRRVLPPLKNESSTFEHLRRSIEDCLKGERTQQIIHRINSYKSILQLSLTSLSLGALSETEKSQQKIQADVRKLAEFIQPYRLPLGRNNNDNTLLARTHSLGSEPNGEDSDINTLEKEICEWRRTASDVVTKAMSQSDNASSIHPSSSVSVDTLTLYEDEFDPEPDRRDVQSSEILEYQLRENQNLVRGFIQCEIFVQAAKYRQKGIVLMEQLLEARVPTILGDTSYEQLTNMKEELADLYLQCNSVEGELKSKEVLQDLLKEEASREGDQVNTDRGARLYHKLGRLYFREGKVKTARKFVNRAMEIRKQNLSTQHELVRESAELLAKILQQDGAVDEAGGIREWIRQELRPDTSNVSSTSSQKTQDESWNSVDMDRTVAYQWCKEQDMDVDSKAFGFDICNPESGTTPIHCAVKKEKIEVVRHMLSYGANVEKRDDFGSTLLHTAAATRNRDVCALLLEYEADPNVVDKAGMTPLHKCQSGSGALQVAEMLLESCPELLNQTDHFGKTALYMACEKGNVKMVKFLLSNERVDPNIPGPGQCTPLITAIDVAAKSSRKIGVVKMLLERNADPDKADADGRTALAAANAGLAASEIRRLLNQHSARRESLSSISTAKSSCNSRKISNTSGI